MTALIVGAGAHGRVILDTLRASGKHETIQFIDDDERLRGSRVNGALVTGTVQQALAQNAPDREFIVALGNPIGRLTLAGKLRAGGAAFLNAIHPSAVVMPSAKLGRGNMIAPTAVINSDARIGDHTIVNTGAVIEHDSSLGNGVTVGPGAHVGGRATLMEAAFLGTGSILLSRVSVGPQTVIAAGAVVTRDLPGGVLALGIPARVREPIGPDFDWTRLL